MIDEVNLFFRTLLDRGLNEEQRMIGSVRSFDRSVEFLMFRCFLLATHFEAFNDERRERLFFDL
jgi:hypothetical protein